MVMHVAKLIAYRQSAILPLHAVLDGLALGPLMVGGSFAGKKIVDRVSERVFTAIIELTLLAAGVGVSLEGMRWSGMARTVSVLRIARPSGDCKVPGSALTSRRRSGGRAPRGGLAWRTAPGSACPRMGVTRRPAIPRTAGSPVAGRRHRAPLPPGGCVG